MSGPLHRTAELVGSRRIGAYHRLTLLSPEIAERARPGSFVAVSVGESRLARRALWVHQVRPMGGLGLALELVLQPRGVGTRWLAALPVGARLDVTGPLGRPFALPAEPVSCVLVAEGYAAAPLFPLAERLRERGCEVALVVGAEDEQHLLSALEARRTVSTLTVVTKDGSVGRRGHVADALPGVLDRAATRVVYAAGEASSLGAVAEVAQARGVPCQTALEWPLTCATGLCHGCLVPVVGDDGTDRTARACVDGPVFGGHRVRWGAIA